MFILIKILTILGEFFSLCHSEERSDVRISRKGNLVLIDTNFDLFLGVFAKIIAKKNKYYG